MLPAGTFFFGGAMLPTSLLLRLAQRLHAVWAGRAEKTPDPGDAWCALDNRLGLARTTRHRIDLARDANLSLIVPQLMGEVAAHLNAVFRQVERLQAEYVPFPVRVPDLGDLVAEARQLEAEFGAVEIRWD